MNKIVYIIYVLNVHFNCLRISSFCLIYICVYTHTHTHTHAHAHTHVCVCVCVCVCMNRLFINNHKNSYGTFLVYNREVLDFIVNSCL